MPQKSVPYVLTQEKALSSLQKTLASFTTRLRNLLEGGEFSEAFDASHLVAAAQLEEGMNVHVSSAYQIGRIDEEGGLTLDAPRSCITTDGHLVPNMKAAVEALVTIGKIHPKVIDALPDVSPAALIDADIHEEEGSE